MYYTRRLETSSTLPWEPQIIQKGIFLHGDDCTCTVVWSFAVILFTAIMQSLLLPHPPSFTVAIK